MGIELKKDQLATSLINEMSTKTNEVFDTLGKIDLALASIYLVMNNQELNGYVEVVFLRDVCRNLQYIMSEVAGSPQLITMSDLEKLYSETSSIQLNGGHLTSFIQPSSRVSAELNMTRTLVRQAELSLAKIYELKKVSQVSLEYVNKLSLYLFWLGARR